MEERFYALVFYSGHGAAVMQKYLAEKGFSLRPMPTLRILSTSCSTSLRIPQTDLAAVRWAVESGPVSRDQYRFYFVRMVDGKPIANPM
ncbi:MAG: DUF3343 domain-containing protein [Clostridiales bacterium]